MTWQDIIAIADQLEPEARAAFLSAVARLRQDLDVEQLASLIESGRLQSADFAADLKPFQDDLQLVIDVAQRAFQQVGSATAQQLSSSLGLTLRFDLTNAFAVTAARQLSALLVTNITEETRLAIKTLITRAFTEGLTRRQISSLLRPLIGLTTGQTGAVLNYRQSWIDLGLNAAMVEKKTSAYAAKLLRERSQTIARYEIMAAANAGQLALWKQAQSRGLLGATVKRRWLVGPAINDNAPCMRCRAMDGKEAGLNEEFVSDTDSVIGPPMHPRCRCTTVLVPSTMRSGAAA